MEPITANTMTLVNGESFVEFYPPQYMGWVEFLPIGNPEPGLLVHKDEDHYKILILANTSRAGWVNRVRRDAVEYERLVDEQTARFIELFVQRALPYIQDGVIPWM